MTNDALLAGTLSGLGGVMVTQVVTVVRDGRRERLRRAEAQAAESEGRIHNLETEVTGLREEMAGLTAIVNAWFNRSQIGDGA